MGNCDLLLVDKAYEEIRKGIYDRLYQPGSKLSSSEIAERLGMSRTPVVSAINRLIAQGLATEVPRRGVIVAHLRPNQIRNSIDVRRMMETFAVPYAIKNAIYFPDLVDEMEDLANQLQKLSATAYHQVTVLENQFHTNLIKLTNNSQLLRLYEANWGVGFATYTYLISNSPIRRYHESCQEHLEYVECLRTGDEDRLRNLAERHFDFIYSMLDLLSHSSIFE